MQQPIGIFDSGIGGTSIWNEIRKLLPHENSIYLADSLNSPYGEKSTEEIIELCIKNTSFLLDKGCKLIVVACNTATTNAISTLRAKYHLPFIGIEPAIKPAALQTKTFNIGVLATKGTLSSALFSSTSQTFASTIQVHEQIGEGIVQLMEQGKMNSIEMDNLLKRYLSPMLEKNIDHLVLGCTHYPYLIPQIKTLLGPNVHIIDSGLAVAKQTKSILTREQLSNTSRSKGKHEFYSNGAIATLQQIVVDHCNTSENLTFYKERL